MYTLIIGNSKSRNFRQAVSVARLFGGEFDGENITIKVDEPMKAYERFFPLFRLNVMTWKNTRAYYNGNKVHPYRFMLLMEQKRRTFYAQVLEQLKGDLHRTGSITPFLYYQRDGNTFFFRGEKRSFELELKDKMLYEFVDRYDVGDIVYFE